ncbi:carbohydrate binding domain-containing protein [Microbacterium sp. ABRD28]|uniref:carbohydrate binding domain-containing protein n=1 Tax=Microbacterium sp. ABRD28 TaxID=2268461 RepID=UPI000F700081|nr:carbohydrate binding domain-containing protein [Microbacterium sp. ABRD28]AZC13140.1 hypothetical protein DT073_04955 [Microbacterium sp. ABRD28]
MPRHAPFVRVSATAAAVALLLTGVSPAAHGAESLETFRDFESGTSDHIQWGSAGAGVQTVADAGTGSYPDSGPNTHVLSYGFDVSAAGAFGGIGFERPADVPAVDWAAYDGVQFWMHGDGTQSSIQVEIMDAASADAGVSDRWDTVVPVGNGWSLVKLPWSAFGFATDYQDGGAPNDGTLDLDFVRGLLFPANAGAATVKMDAISLFSADGPVAATVGFDRTATSVTEGETATLPVSLSRAAEGPVTVEVVTSDGTAIAGTDYTAIAETITIPAGTTGVDVEVGTTADEEVNGNRTLTVSLATPAGADLGVSTATITIRDDDAAPAAPISLLTDTVEDFEAELVLGDPAAVPPLGWFAAQGAGNVPSIERVADATRPGAAEGNDVLQLGLDTSSWAVVIDNFTDGTSWVPQDWSAYRGVGFWMKGTNSGAPMFVDLLDNRNPGSTVDDAERFSVQFVDDFTGWRFIELPFEDFARKNIGNGAPDDGLTLTEVHGFGIGVEQTSTPVTPVIRLDDIGLVEYQQTVEDFEAELVLGDPAAVPPLGWFAAQGAGNVPSIERVADATRPGAAEGNDVLQLGLDTSSWAVVIDNFTDGTSWVPQDWSAYRGVGFWMKGTNSGAPMFVDLLDNRNPGSTVDDAERFSVQFVDDFTGWRFIELPFEDFARKNIGNGAPDDGLTLTEVHGFGIGVEQTSTPVTPIIRLDDLTLVGQSDANRPLQLNFARSTFVVAEGDTAAVELRLSRVSEEDVTVSYATEVAEYRTSTEDLPATADRDFVPTSGTVTIPAGEQSAVIEVATIDDDKAEVDETFVIRLSEPVGAELGMSAIGRVSITDTDVAPDGMLEDFESGAGLLRPTGEAEISTREIAAGDDGAYEGQSSFENVLDIEGAGGFARELEQSQDWSAREGLGFWYRGAGDGRTVTVGLDDGTTERVGPEGWELAWSDEFDAPAGTPADERWWTYETGGWGWGNDELQYYTDSTENAAHDGEGNMVITTRAVEDPAASGLECWYGPCEYTSARLITEGKVEALHGRIEARAQMPDGEPGIWPAIWSLGNDFRDVGWPQTGEIDVMEYVGKLPDEIFGTIHGPGYSGGNAYGQTYDFGEDLSNRWLTFAVEWETEEIRWYVQLEDGEEILFHTATPEDVAPSEWVYEHAFTFLMNMAVGGNFGGPLGADLTFPQELKVDYLRVFQAPDDAERFRASFTDDVAGWRYVEVPFDAFERSDEQPEGAPDDGLQLTSVSGYRVSTDQAEAVAVDRLQVLTEITDPVPGVDPGPDPGPDPGTDPGAGQPGVPGAGAPGQPAAGEGPRGVLGATGAEGPWAAVAAGLTLLLAGLVLALRRIVRRHDLGGSEV